MADMKVTVKLKNGDTFPALYERGHQFSPKSLTIDTVHNIALENGKHLVVQGDQIAYMLAE